MSEKTEKRKRLNERLQFVREFELWIASEPPRWRFIRWRKWLDARPDVHRIDHLEVDGNG